MEKLKNIKIEKGKSYTYEQLKEIYQNAMIKTMDKPAGDKHTDDANFQLTMMLSGMVILHTMEDNMFEKEKKEDA